MSRFLSVIVILCLLACSGAVNTRTNLKKLQTKQQQQQQRTLQQVDPVVAPAAVAVPPPAAAVPTTEPAAVPTTPASADAAPKAEPAGTDDKPAPEDNNAETNANTAVTEVEKVVEAKTRPRVDAAGNKIGKGWKEKLREEQEANAYYQPELKKPTLADKDQEVSDEEVDKMAQTDFAPIDALEAANATATAEMAAKQKEGEGGAHGEFDKLIQEAKDLLTKVDQHFQKTGAPHVGGGPVEETPGAAVQQAQQQVAAGEEPAQVAEHAAAGAEAAAGEASQEAAVAEGEAAKAEAEGGGETAKAAEAEATAAEAEAGAAKADAAAAEGAAVEAKGEPPVEAQEAAAAASADAAKAGEAEVAATKDAAAAAPPALLSTHESSPSPVPMAAPSFSFMPDMIETSSSIVEKAPTEGIKQFVPKRDFAMGAPVQPQPVQ